MAPRLPLLVMLITGLMHNSPLDAAQTCVFLEQRVDGTVQAYPAPCPCDISIPTDTDDDGPSILGKLASWTAPVLSGTAVWRNVRACLTPWVGSSMNAELARDFFAGICSAAVATAAIEYPTHALYGRMAMLAYGASFTVSDYWKQYWNTGQGTKQRTKKRKNNHRSKSGSATPRTVEKNPPAPTPTSTQRMLSEAWRARQALLVGTMAVVCYEGLKTERYLG